MIFTTLDTITRRSLLERRRPIHYYIEYLTHHAAALRELSIDTLKVVKTVEIPVGSYYELDLPDDFMDDVAVAIPVGNLLHPISKNTAITALRAKDNAGNFIPYSDQTSHDDTALFGLGGSWFFNVNEYGESTGRYFGADGGERKNGYQLFKERRQIQLTESFTSDTAILIYLSDGQSADNATQIDTMAFAAIQAYSAWKVSPNADNQNSPEASNFYNQRRILRARLDDLTVTDIRQILHKAYHGGLKN